MLNYLAVYRKSTRRILYNGILRPETKRNEKRLKVHIVSNEKRPRTILINVIIFDLFH